MKNKLLVSVFAVAIAALALTSCEPKSDVTAVCTDMLKLTLHGASTGTSAVRGLVKLDGKTLILAEYEFPSKDVNDPNLLYRSIAFGDGTFEPKKVDSLTYKYGEWEDKGTTFTLYVTPRTDSPYVLRLNGDAFYAPDGRVYGGSTAANVARVEKLEKVIATFPNTDWEATFEGDFVLDSVFRDSVRWIPFPKPGHWDTIPWFDHMDTVAADTVCNYKWNFERDKNSLANTGHYYQKETRKKYDRATKQSTIISEKVYEYDFHWMISELSSDQKFVVQLPEATEADEKGKKLSIAKFTLDDAEEASSFLLDGLTFTRPVKP